jgi:hypothetical protein
VRQVSVRFRRSIHLVACATVLAAFAGGVNAQTEPAATQAPGPTVAAPAAATPAPSASPSAPAATASSTAASNSAATPSADTLKQARKAGYYTKVRAGQTFFCKKDATIGTRLATEKCFDEDQLATQLELNQAQRDQLRNSSCGGSGACGGK